jgi:hypothetical protein
LPLCNAEKIMQSSHPPAETPAPAPLLLAIDTCGPSGSVALGRFCEDQIQILGQIELEGRSYSATLVAAVAELLPQSNGCVARVKDRGSVGTLLASSRDPRIGRKK